MKKFKKFASLVLMFGLLAFNTSPLIAVALDEMPTASEQITGEVSPEILTETVSEKTTQEIVQPIPLVGVIANNYNLNFICDTGWCAGQVFSHTMTINPEEGSGDFTGTGQKPDVTWEMTGHFADPAITMHITYITGPDAGYMMDLTGTRAPNGVMSGTATDSGQQAFRWTTSDVITVTATKIVCDNETDLPNWATNGTVPEEITADTATNWIAEHSDTCHLESGWDFQWGDQNTSYPADGDTHIGVMSGYQTFGTPTDSNGKTSVIIPVADITQLHFAEVQKDGYIPFTSQAFPGNTNDVSAEFYCMTDIANYDNYEGLGLPEDGTDIVPNKHYYCVAWNVIKTTQPPEVCNPDVNLIENGGFESPALSNGTWSIVEDINLDPGSVLKWLVAWATPQTGGTLGLEIQNNAVGTPFAGNQLAELDGDHPVTIWQDVPTVPGKEYSFSFKYSPRPGVALADNSLQVKIDGSVLGVDIATDGTANGNTVWENITRTFIAIGATTKVEIYDNGTDTSLGGYVDNADLRCVGEPQEEGRGKIHVIKFINGVRATAENADNASFPMDINNPDGDFVLKPSGWVSGDGVYEATTHVHKKGSTFTIAENLSTDLVGTSCEQGRPFALAGYSTASTYNDAIVAPQSTVAPAITIDGDKYLIVHNISCVDNPQVPGKGKIHVIKFINGVRATAENADNASFPMDINNPDGDFVLKPSGWVSGDGVYEATTHVHKKGSTFTIAENLSTDLVGTSCEQGRPFALAGYSTASTYNDAIVAPQSTVAPAITIDGDKYLIVHNTKCGVEEVIYACSDGVDNDQDGNVDYPSDIGCSGPTDNDESNTIDTSGGGGGGGNGGGRTRSSGSVLGASTKAVTPTPLGQVLGATTSCDVIDTFLRKGYKNDPESVKKIQEFLNDYIKAGLKVDGKYGTTTEKAVRKFQVMENSKVLSPWGFTKPTGIFYQTTLTQYKNIKCPELKLPIPTLIPIEKNPLAPKK